jgi:uncharacterized protein (TIGR00251 family)
MVSNIPKDILDIVETDDGVIFTVYVQPRASRNELCGISGNEIKLRLTSPPVDGSANRLCTEYLAELLGIAKSKVRILRGEKSRHKTIKAYNVKKEEITALLNM